MDGKPERSAELCPLFFELFFKAFSLAALQCQNNISCHRTTSYNVKTRGITHKLKWAYTYPKKEKVAMFSHVLEKIKSATYTPVSDI